MSGSRPIRLEEIRVELRLLSERIEEAAFEALGLERMVATAKTFCPVRRGLLRESIRSERRGRSESLLVAGGEGFMDTSTGRPVDYARLVHDGTSGRPGRPFLLQAVEAEKHVLADELLRGVSSIR